MGAQSRSAKAGDAARSVASNPYVRRLLEDDELRENIRVAFEAARGALTSLASDVHLEPSNRTLQVRALNAVGNLPAILAALQQLGAQPVEVNIRANTLEDVFIQLTGRRLRE